MCLYVIYNPLRNQYLGSQWMSNKEVTAFVLQYSDISDYDLMTYEEWTQVSAMEAIRNAVAAAA